MLTFDDDSSSEGRSSLRSIDHYQVLVADCVLNMGIFIKQPKHGNEMGFY